MWNLCSGKTWAKPSASSIDVGDRRRSRRAWTSPRPAASRMFAPSPSFVAVSWAMASASPVTILTCTPSCRAVAMVALRVFARRVEQRQHAERAASAPSPSARATPSDRKPRAANSLTASSTRRLHLAGVGRQREDHLRRALGHLERAAVRRLDRGLGALADRVERLEVDHVDTPSSASVAWQAAEHGEIDRVVVVGARRQRGGEDDLLGA